MLNFFKKLLQAIRDYFQDIADLENEKLIPPPGDD